MSDLILLKLGGSLITDKTTPLSPRSDTIQRISQEIHEAKQKSRLNLIVGHGGGSFPHKFAEEYNTHLGIISKESYKGISLVQDAAARLNRIIIKSLIESGENAISIQVSAAAIAENGRIKNWYIEPLKEMLEKRLLPVPYGDVMLDLSKGCCIISTEEILNYLARYLSSKRIIIAGTTDGVFNMDPKKPDAKLIPEINSKNYIDVRKYLTGSAGIDVTGGMLHKVDRMFELTRLGFEAEIINGNKEGNLKRALLGERNLGTTIKF
jgi:isopentenyl phosphate kinase